MDKIEFSADKLKARREELGLDLNDVVAKLWEMGHKKASIQLIKDYESGKYKPGMEYALSLASIYHCSIHHFTDKGKE